MRRFNEKHASVVALAVDVWRRPYSFLGDSPEGRGRIRNTTWHESLIDYTDGTETSALRFERSLNALGARNDVTFDFDVKTHWQPVESQRAQLWASRFGKAELFMDRLGMAHFTQKRSASDRQTLLACASEIGLDADALDAFLRTDELREEVWRSYGETIREMGIGSIPLFLFSLEPNGGPFRDNAGRTFAHGGSGSADDFLEVFEAAWVAAKGERES